MEKKNIQNFQYLQQYLLKCVEMFLTHDFL